MVNSANWASLIDIYCILSLVETKCLSFNALCTELCGVLIVR